MSTLNDAVVTYCSQCGQQLSNQAKFCTRCRAPQPGNAPAPAVLPAQPSYPARGAHEMARPTPPMQGAIPGQQPDGRIVSVGEWMLMTLVLMIPVVNLVMAFVWAFSYDGSVTKTNYFKAALIWGAICIGIWIILFAIFGAALFSLAR